MECLAVMDWDLGTSAPVKIELRDAPAVLVQSGKDGGLYLVDAERMGVLYDRRQLVSPAACRVRNAMAYGGA